MRKTARKPVEKALSDLQQKFVEQYALTLNATEAYRSAGYKVKNEKIACVNASRLLANAKVAQAVQEALANRARRVALTQDEVITLLRQEATFHGRGAQHAARVKACEVLARMGGFISDLHFHKHDHKHAEAQQKLTVSSQEVIDQLPLEAKLTMLEAIAKARAQKAQSSLPKLIGATELSPPPNEEASQEAHPEASREASQEAHPEAYVIDVEAQVVELPESSS